MFLAVFYSNKLKSWENCQQTPAALAEKSQFWKIFNFDKNFKEFLLFYKKMCRILDLFRINPIELLQLPIKIDHECSKRWKFREKVTRSGQNRDEKILFHKHFLLKLTEERRMSYFFHLPRSFEKKPFFKVKILKLIDLIN